MSKSIDRLDMIETADGLYIEHTTTACLPDPEIGESMVFIYAAHGSAHFLCGDFKADLSDGDIIILNRNSGYEFSTEKFADAMGIYCCYFNEDSLPFTFAEMGRTFELLKPFFSGRDKLLFLQDTPNKRIRNAMVSMIDYFTMKPPGFEYALGATLTQILIDCFNIIISPKKKEAALNKNFIVGHFTNYVNKHITQKIPINESAEYLHITPQHLCRTLRKNTGMSYTEYINHLRVDKIKDLLRNTDRPVMTICDNFELSTNYLNSVFKKITGMTINDYKQKYNYKVNNPLFAGK